MPPPTTTTDLPDSWVTNFDGVIDRPRDKSYVTRPNEVVLTDLEKENETKNSYEIDPDVQLNLSVFTD